MDSSRPDADKMKAAFRSVLIPRIRGELENYVYYLLDILKTPSAARPSSKPVHKPVWLKTSQPELADGENSAPTSQQAAANADIFQEREGGLFIINYKNKTFQYLTKIL